MNTDEKALLFRIGLARKAGALLPGTDMVCDAVRRGHVFAVIVASDVSGNTEKRIDDTCRFHRVPLLRCEADRGALGAAIGKGFAACVGITDRNLAKLILSNQNRTE